MASETLQGLERGLAVIQAFTHKTPSMTVSEVARQTDISRATARRILHTLEALGFVRADDRRFSLSPRVLSLGWAYLSSLNLWEIAQPFMEDLSREVQQTCSATTLDLPDAEVAAHLAATPLEPHACRSRRRTAASSPRCSALRAPSRMPGPHTPRRETMAADVRAAA